MSFKIIGNIDVTVIDAYIAAPHWEAKPGEINNKGIPVVVWGDVCLVVADKDGNNDIWKGELSNRTGNGTRAHQEQTEITIEKLLEIGFNTPTFNDLVNMCEDDNSIPGMIGAECSITTEEREYEGRDGKIRKTIFVKYINARGAGGPRRISKADFLARINGQILEPQPADADVAAPAQYPAPQGYPQPQGYPAPGYPQQAATPTPPYGAAQPAAAAQYPQQGGNVPPCPYN